MERLYRGCEIFRECNKRTYSIKGDGECFTEMVMVSKT